jgi:UDP-N-acetylglucosamine 2-epimerase
MKILTVVGARPQFVKAAALSHAIARRRSTGERIDEIIVHTGQHYDRTMSDVFFDELGIPTPQYDLGVGSASHGAQTGLMMQRLEPVVAAEAPDAVLVYGDTNSTVAGSLVAAKSHVPVVHVEAGLRSYDRRMPEELNRIVADHLSTLLCCPSRTAVDNLAAEGITRGVEFTGDVMLEVLRAAQAHVGLENPVADRLGLDAPYVVATMHRAANTDDEHRAAEILTGLCRVAETGRAVVFPVHPRSRALLADHVGSQHLHLTEPLGYREMVALMAGAAVVVTDSGGLQKEAAWLGVPCVTTRDETEWPETVDLGWNVLVGADAIRIGDAVERATRPSASFDAYGTGDASERVIGALVSMGSR